MKPIASAALALALALAAAPLTATATTLDFEAFASTSNANFASPFLTQGYKFVGNGIASDYNIAGSTDAARFTGSAALTPFFSETHVLSRVDGASFDLLSLDFSEYATVSTSDSITFTGNYAAGGTVTNTLLSDGIFGMEGYVFAGFTGLSSVVFTHGLNSGFQYDNIVVQASDVPLPAALPLSLAGLAALGLIGRRRARA